MAVQNQTGRFPNKWDKTGIVVENIDHDKVFVRLDGSSRLTTRNRRFVRKIVSPPDIRDEELVPAVLRESTSDSRDEVLVPTVLGDSHSDSMLGNVEDDTLATELVTVEPDTSDAWYEAPAMVERDIKTETELSSGKVQHENEM